MRGSIALHMQDQIKGWLTAGAVWWMDSLANEARQYNGRQTKSVETKGRECVWKMLKCLARNLWILVYGRKMMKKWRWKGGKEKCEAEEENECFSHCWAPIGWAWRIYVLERLRFPATWMLSAMVNWMLWSNVRTGCFLIVKFQQFFSSEKKKDESGREKKWNKEWKKGRKTGEKKRQKRPSSNTNFKSPEQW